MSPCNGNARTKVWCSLLVSALASISACGGGSKQQMTACQGAERCACYPNQTCNAGLDCLSNLCVSLTSGSGGVNGIGGNSIGGATGTGGMVTSGSGGESVSTGTGGMAATGTGGMTATGTGGMTATGTGGMTATGSGGMTATGTGGAAPVGPNLIKNGDFAMGKVYWDLTYQAGEIAGETYSGGEYCIYNLSDIYFLSFSLGYPPTPSDAFVIDPGATYTLSYTAHGSYAPAIMPKIGHATTPYTELTSFQDTASTLPQTFSHQITSATGDTGAGLVFNGTLDYLGDVCFDNVTLVKN